MKNKQLQGGLKKLPSDNRDYAFGRVFAPPVDIPDEFILPKRRVLNQGQSDMCAAFSAVLASEYQEEVNLYPPYSFALAKEMTGDVESWGLSLRDIHKALQLGGSIEEGKTAVNSRYIDDYEDLYQEAYKHRKKSYFKLTEGDIKGFIWKNKQPVVIGVIWSWNLGEKYLTGIKEGGYGHALAVIGFKGDYYIIQNSYGEEAGDKGLHYIHKDTVKYFIDKYGCYGMVDIEKETAKELNERAEWSQAGYLKKLLILFKRLWL